MEALNKNKEEIEKMQKGCGYLVSYSKSSECGKNGWICDECYIPLQERIKTSILWCEDEIEFINIIFKKISFLDETSLMDKKREKLQTHLTWLKEQEKNNNG
jgi:hypothetical protein